jgi:hypothetical protein
VPFVQLYHRSQKRLEEAADRCDINLQQNYKFVVKHHLVMSHHNRRSRNFGFHGTKLNHNKNQNLRSLNIDVANEHVYSKYNQSGGRYVLFIVQMMSAMGKMLR